MRFENYLVEIINNIDEEHISYEDMTITIENGRCSSYEYDWNKNYVD